VGEIASQLFRSTTVKPSRSGRRRADQWANVWGAEPVDTDTVRIRGVCLFERIEEGRYRATPWAIELGQSYRASPGDHGWLARLGEILARYDPRLRTLLWHLGALDYRLRLPPDEPTVGMGDLALLSPTGESLFPLQAEDPGNLNALLQAHRDRAIGPFWQERFARLGYQVGRPIGAIVGVKRREPSFSRLTVTIAWALQVYRDLRVLAEDDDRHLTVNRELAEEFFSPALYDDLWARQVGPAFLLALYQTFQARRRPDGYAVYADLRQRVISQGAAASAEDFDQQFRAYLREGRLQIVRHAQGLRADGPGYQDQPDHQLIELIFDRKYTYSP